MPRQIICIYIDTLARRLDLTLKDGERLEFDLTSEAILADEFSVHELINIRDLELKSWIADIAHNKMGRTITREVNTQMDIDAKLPEVNQ